MADLELFRRALPGTRAYFPVLLVTLLGMHFPWDYPWLVGGFVPVFVLAGISRYALLGRALRNYTLDPNLWRGRFRRTILLTPLVWGLFGAAVVLLSGQHWDVAFCIVVSAGQGSGAAASLHPDLLLTGLPGLALAVLSTVFMIYLIKLGDEMGRRYWNHLSDRLFAIAPTRSVPMTSKSCEPFATRPPPLWNEPGSLPKSGAWLSMTN